MLNNFFRINMPYVIRGNNKDGWLTLNREYKPLGFNNPTDYVHYDDYAIKSKFNITKSKIEKLKSETELKQILKLLDELKSLAFTDKYQIRKRGYLKKESAEIFANEISLAEN